MIRPHYRISPERASRFRGCLLGGGVGDALGAPVEFMTLEKIRSKFGDDGIGDYAPAYGRLGAITDDTQMTLFTAEGILRAHVRSAQTGINRDPRVIHRAYLRWLATQGYEDPALREYISGWLITLPELWNRRAPGRTCTSALAESKDDPKGLTAPNDSKGCGGLMRVAPLGLFAAAFQENSFDAEAGARAFESGREAAAITHGHPSGSLAAGFFSALITYLATGSELRDAIELAGRILLNYDGSEETRTAIEEAVSLAAGGEASDPCIEKLGQGWVAPEALAISLFCSLRASYFEEGVRMAVNITGDSDSTGAITGNVLGALFGIHDIPERWLFPLELREVISEIADDLATARRWPLSVDREKTTEEHQEFDYWNARYPGN